MKKGIKFVVGQHGGQTNKYNVGIEIERSVADILFSNSIMALNLHHACEWAGVKKLISIMTSCAYPDTGVEILKEED